MAESDKDRPAGQPVDPKATDEKNTPDLAQQQKVAAENTARIAEQKRQQDARLARQEQARLATQGNAQAKNSTQPEEQKPSKQADMQRKAGRPADPRGEGMQLANAGERADKFARIDQADEVDLKTRALPDSPGPQLTDYAASQSVRAAKILSIGEPDEFGIVTMALDTAPASSVRVVEEFMTTREPEIGEYYVVYEDGFESTSPAALFNSAFKAKKP